MDNHINSFVLVESKDKLGNLKLHICLESTNLNKAIIQEPYHFKMLDDTAHLISESCVMTVCNCKKGYWHQRLDEASSYLNTFNTRIGCFRYTVMPFGATVTGDVFQHKLSMLWPYKKCHCHLGWHNDYSKQQNHRDHDHTLTTLLGTTRCCNVRLNDEKLQYKKEEMPAPTCQKQVQSFIGMVNYLTKFSTHLSKLAEPIRELSKEKVPFNWGPEHQEAFQLMKKKLQLHHFWLTITQGNRQSCKLMQALKNWDHACYKTTNQYILPAKH